MRHHRPLVICLALSLLVGLSVAAESPPEGPTTLILVRHAEKAADGGRDPALTAAGKERAAELVRVLADVPLDAVYSSQYRRTRDTARPTAEAHGLEVQVVPAAAPVAEYAQSFAATLLKGHRGGTILVSGHSNTVPAILSALGVERSITIDDGEYDDLFVVTVDEANRAIALRLGYGAPTP
ncbi:MAG: histidine phosphatase family protein [bacterium]|nr:histidine phosphatase family protein [bacterium]